MISSNNHFKKFMNINKVIVNKRPFILIIYYRTFYSRKEFFPNLLSNRAKTPVIFKFSIIKRNIFYKYGTLYKERYFGF